MEDVTSFTAITLDLRPDVVKIWPQDDQYAVVGTYTLLEDEPSESEGPQQRVGSLNLVQVVNGKLVVAQTLSTPFGVYDLHFAGDDCVISRQFPGIFAVGTSTGSIAFYQVVCSNQDNTASHPKIQHLHTVQHFSKDVLVTSLAWHTEGFIALTLSDGRVCVTKFNGSGEDSLLPVELTQHDFQAWTCSFVEHREGDRLYYGLVSGGDDATLRYTGLSADQWTAMQRERDSSSEPAQRMPWVERKIHQAGVTAVLPLGNTPSGFLLITGSYDDHIRLLHCPAVGRREVLAEAYLGGGVFRVKITEEGSQVVPDSVETKQAYTLIVSCMQAGARIVTLRQSGDEWHFDVQAKFEQNAGTLLYASDCQSNRTIISTSFEDRKLYLWRLS